MTQPPNPDLPKRFYKDVAVVDVAGGAWRGARRSSYKNSGTKPTDCSDEALADAVAAEWQRQTEVIDLDTMPLTRLAQRAVDSAGHGRDRMISEIMKFSQSDLLCYRATDPDPLAKLQTSEWQPLLDWAARELGVQLDVTAA